MFTDFKKDKIQLSAILLCLAIIVKKECKEAASMVLIRVLELDQQY